MRNPRARRAPAEEALRAVAAPLVAAGWRVDIETTRRAGEGTDLAARAVRDGIDVVAACGGDGTVHEVANGLVGSATALAVIPAGTANVWAREAGIARNAAGAFAQIATARRVRIDVGRVRVASGAERRFLLMCGIGVDAAAVRRVGSDSRWKRRLGRARYVAAGLAALLGEPAADARVRVDGREVRGAVLEVLVGNTRLYGGVTRLTSAALVDDGLLDICTFRGGGVVRRAWLAARALRGELHAHTGGGITYERGTRIEVATVDAARALPVQADGEYIGETPVDIEVEPAALTVLIAPGRNALLREE